MSNIDELLSKLAPQGVEHLELGSVAAIHRGVRITKNDLISDGNVPVVSGGTGFMGFFNESNRSANIITIAQYGTAGYVNWQTREFWANDVCFTVEPLENRILAKYLYYFLMSKQSHLYSLSNRNAVPYSIERSRILSISVPVPPLEIQGEIVEILDSFQALEAELEAELEARRKQYEYYRNQLLSFPEQGGVRWVPMGEVVKIRNGSDWKGLEGGDYPVFGSGGRMGTVGRAIHSGPSVLIPRKGSLGNLFYVDEPFWTVDTCFYTEITVEQLLPKYFYHYMKTKDLTELNMAGGVPSLTQTQLNRILIPVPDLKKQGEIADVLDSFCSLIEGFDIGLPSEIKARRKQYEYYRDKLLTFQELKTS